MQEEDTDTRKRPIFFNYCKIRIFLFFSEIFVSSFSFGRDGERKRGVGLWWSYGGRKRFIGEKGKPDKTGEEREAPTGRTAFYQF